MTGTEIVLIAIGGTLAFAAFMTLLVFAIKWISDGRGTKGNIFILLLFLFFAWPLGIAYGLTRDWK